MTRFNKPLQLLIQIFFYKILVAQKPIYLYWFIIGLIRLSLKQIKISTKTKCLINRAGLCEWIFLRVRNQNYITHIRKMGFAWLFKFTLSICIYIAKKYSLIFVVVVVYILLLVLLFLRKLNYFVWHFSFNFYE